METFHDKGTLKDEKMAFNDEIAWECIKKTLNCQLTFLKLINLKDDIDLGSLHQIMVFLILIQVPTNFNFGIILVKTGAESLEECLQNNSILT